MAFGTPTWDRHFNPRSREGSDRLSMLIQSLICNFNPRSREGSDPCSLVVNSSWLYFNPRSREGSDIFFIIGLFFLTVFQSTLPRRERLVFPNKKPDSTEFQSTLPRRERLVFCILFIINGRNFNPRSREGSDPFFHRWCMVQNISIHAPAKGATQTVPDIPVLHCNFNPRSREGSDLAPTPTCLEDGISIHAPAKGATGVVGFECYGTSISIHAPAKGATSLPERQPKHLQISIHAPAKGATLRMLFIWLLSIFQSTLPRRERLIRK